MSIQATRQQFEDTGLALGRASLFDNKIGDTDKARTAVWAEALAPYRFELPDLLNAVTAYYRAEPQRTIMPADVIRLGREARTDRGMRDAAPDREARELRNGQRLGLVAPDVQLGGLPIGGADGSPVWEAYEINGAIDRECPTCGEPANGACVNRVNDKARKIPCLSRMKLPK